MEKSSKIALGLAAAFLAVLIFGLKAMPADRLNRPVGAFDTPEVSSSGIGSLNGLTGSTQTFTNDTNVTIVSGGTAHVITWAGTLADSRVIDALTISGGTINNSPIGASTPSTAIFSNSTSTNATSTTHSIGTLFSSAKSDGCATWASGVLNSVGSACASGLSGGAANKIAVWSGASTLTQSDYFHFDSTNFRTGIGSSSPFALLSIAAVPNGTDPLVSISTSTPTATSSVFTISPGGNVGISSSTPMAGLSLGNGRAIVPTEFVIATSSSFNVSLLNGNKQLARIGAGAVTITFTDFVPGGSVNLKVCNPNGTAGAVTFAASPGLIAPVGQAIPTQTTTANRCDTWVADATAATSTLNIFLSQAANY